MEQYVYLSIMFFSLITFFLYIYIVIEKTIETYQSKRRNKYYIKLVPYIDFIANEIMDGKELELFATKNLRKLCRNKEKREIIEERLLYYFENYKGEFIPRLTELCQYVKIIKWEIENLKDKNNFKKALAAKRLGEFRSWKSAGALLKQLKTTNSDVQYNVLLSLAKIGDEEYFINAFENIDSKMILSERSLIEIVDSFEGNKHKIYKHMINVDNSFIAGIFIKSAGNNKDIMLSEEIAKYLLSENKELRIASVKALGNMCDEAYLDDIIKLLEDDQWEVRAVTAKALGSFTNSKILIPLKKALSDFQWYVRYNAATAILNHEGGISIISEILYGEDKFAKDIIISALENSSNNFLSLEGSDNPDKKALVLQIREYVDMNNKGNVV